MTTKNAKTILFASLIATMIIPVSATIFAYADNNQSVQVVDGVTKNYINAKINELSTKKSSTDKDLSDLNKLQLIKKWIKATERGNVEKARDLAAQITADFPSDDEYTAATQNPDGMIGKNYHYVQYTGSIEKHWDCRDDSDLLGNVEGSLTGYSSSLYIVSDMDYPDEITDGPMGLNCTTPDWERSKAKYTETLDLSSNCVIESFSSAGDTEGLYCNELSAGSLVWVQAQAWYDDDIIFSPWASETIKYVWTW